MFRTLSFPVFSLSKYTPRHPVSYWLQLSVFVNGHHIPYSLQPMIPPKYLDIFSPSGRCSEGLDAFRSFFKQPALWLTHTVVYVCMYVWSSHIARVWIDLVKLSILLMVSYFFPCPRSRLRTWSRETGLAAPSRVSLLVYLLRLKLVLTYGFLPSSAAASIFFYLNRHTSSGQS